MLPYSVIHVLIQINSFLIEDTICIMMQEPHRWCNGWRARLECSWWRIWTPQSR